MTKQHYSANSSKEEKPWYPPSRGAIKGIGKEDPMNASKSAVPFPVGENSILAQYDRYSKCYDASVVLTVMEDVRKENEKETQMRLQQEEQNLIRNKEEQQLAEKKIIELMLQLYYFPPKEVLKEENKEEKKMDSGSKKPQQSESKDADKKEVKPQSKEEPKKT